MNKKLLLPLLFIFFCFFIVENVDADTCTTKELNTLKQLAYNINFSYELHDDTYNEDHKYYFDVYATNLSNDFYIRISNGLYFDYSDTDNGNLLIPQLAEGRTYSFEIYTSNNTKCEGTKLMTKKVELPYYNDYSQRAECKGIENFDLCQPYYGGYIESEEFFLEQVEKYKQTLKTNDNKEDNSTGSFITNLINFYVDNLAIAIPMTVILLLLIIILIVKLILNRRKSKVKIKI